MRLDSPSVAPTVMQSDLSFVRTSSNLSNRFKNMTRQKGGSALSMHTDRYKTECFHIEPCLYSHAIFQLGAVIFDALKHELTDDSDNLHVQYSRNKPPEMSVPKTLELPLVEFETEKEKRLTFQLVFQTLKYQKFMEDMLEDCSFFSQYPEYREDAGLVMVLLCDYMSRKFQTRLPLKGEEINPYLREIEENLQRCKTKLNAALARNRIKARVLSINHLLPASVRHNDQIGCNMHTYLWVNYTKTSMEEVIDMLRSDGFTEVGSEGQLVGQTYMLDHQCSDMLCVPHSQHDYLTTHSLMEQGFVVPQDKSSCVGPHSVKALINEGDDVLHVNLGSGLSTAHLASLTHDSDTVITAFGVGSEKQHKAIQTTLDRLGVKSSRVKLHADNFLDVDYNDDRLKHIKVVLINAECSRSGVANPVNFIVTEGEEMSILRDLSLGYTDENKLGEMVIKHNALLKHVMRFPRVQAVIYVTRSLLEAENENVVTRSIEFVNMVQQKKMPFRIAPPVIPLSDRDIELENPLNGKYLRYPPSNVMSGCFVATITREADDPKEAAKDILAKAAARGIISGVPVRDKDDKAQRPKAKSARKSDKSKAHKKATSPRRTKSEKSGANIRPTVSTKLHSKSAARASLFHRSTKHVVTSPTMETGSTTVHTQVFDAPFQYADGTSPPAGRDGYTARHASQSHAAISPHKKIIKHPTPFR